jgi:cation:H+ antiporter
MDLLLSVALLIAGIVLLVQGAKYLIDSSSNMARSLGISELVIGLTIVAAGTSLPEFAISVLASSVEHAEISVSNIIGSNIFNICIIVGILAIYRKRIGDHEEVMHRDIVALILVTAIFAAVSYAGVINATIGVLFLSFFVFYLVYLYSNHTRVVKEHKERVIPVKDLGIFIAAMFVIYFGAKATIDGAVGIATFLAVPEWLIGATIIAAGTSFPETVVSIIALRKKKFYLSLGNIIGSNLFNILLVIGAASMFTPLIIDFAKYFLDYIFLIAATIFVSYVTIKRRFSQNTALFAFGLYILYILMVVVRR